MVADDPVDHDAHCSRCTTITAGKRSKVDVFRGIIKGEGM
jgi:hypothetical protein